MGFPDWGAGPEVKRGLVGVAEAECELMEFDCLPDAASNACVPCSTESTPPTLRCFMRGVDAEGV
jgi:hypothetical protein